MRLGVYWLGCLIRTVADGEGRGGGALLGYN